MPGQDQTGPLGQGPMTGRGLGPCGYGRGLGLRHGFGRGFGFGRMAFGFQPQVITEADEKAMLQDELKAMKEEMKEIEKRLKELKA